jgi:hypothetical protein
VPGRPFQPIVSPRVEEAFGGSNNTKLAIRRILGEFQANSSDREQCAIIGSCGRGDHSFRIWTEDSGEDFIYVPFAEIVQILSADRESFGYGWVFCHTHRLKKKPSKEDDSATCALAWIGKILEIPLVDHWIFTMQDPSIYTYSQKTPKYLSPGVRFEVDRDDD